MHNKSVPRATRNNKQTRFFLCFTNRSIHLYVHSKTISEHPLGLLVVRAKFKVKNRFFFRFLYFTTRIWEENCFILTPIPPIWEEQNVLRTICGLLLWAVSYVCTYIQYRGSIFTTPRGWVLRWAARFWPQTIIGSSANYHITQRLRALSLGCPSVCLSVRC